MNRRELLSMMGAGFGSVGLSSLLAATSRSSSLSVRAPHFSPRAKHVIFLFLNGGLSQVDTFDPKPMLDRHDGGPLPGPKIKTDRASGNLMKSPFGVHRLSRPPAAAGTRERPPLVRSPSPLLPGSGSENASGPPPPASNWDRGRGAPADLPRTDIPFCRT